VLELHSIPFAPTRIRSFVLRNLCCYRHVFPSTGQLDVFPRRSPRSGPATADGAC
jgi:hypothetical protein